MFFHCSLPFQNALKHLPRVMLLCSSELMTRVCFTLVHHRQCWPCYGSQRWKEQNIQSDPFSKNTSSSHARPVINTPCLLITFFLIPSQTWQDCGPFVYLWPKDRVMLFPSWLPSLAGPVRPFRALYTLWAYLPYPKSSTVGEKVVLIPRFYPWTVPPNGFPSSSQTGVCQSVP